MIDYFKYTNIIRGVNFTIGRYDYFLITDAQRITKNVIRDCMRLRLEHTSIGKDITDILNDCYNCEDTRNTFKRLLSFATCTQKHLSNGDFYYTVDGKNYCCSYPEYEFNNEFIIGIQ